MNVDISSCSEYMLPDTPVRSSEHEMGRDQRTSWLYYLPAEAMVSIVHSTDIELTNMYHVLATWKSRGESTQDCQHLIVNSLFEGSHGHSHPRNDGSRNEERGTRNGIWNGFLHCGTKMFPIPASPEWRSRNVDRTLVPRSLRPWDHLVMQGLLWEAFFLLINTISGWNHFEKVETILPQITSYWLNARLNSTIVEQRTNVCPRQFVKSSQKLDNWYFKSHKFSVDGENVSVKMLNSL